MSAPVDAKNRIVLIRYTDSTTQMSNGVVEFTARIDTDHYAGSKSYFGNTIAKGLCPFCRHRVSFTQVGIGKYENEGHLMIPLMCDSCGSICSSDVKENKLYPNPRPEGIEELPEHISSYYDEALRCLQANAPNGAATLFRKTIHAIAIHYDIAEVDDTMRIYEMVKKLHKEGHINQKLRKSLLAVKDLGNDGAHINENEPDMEQALVIKSLIDATLNSTIKADQDIEFAREAHPNEYSDS